MKGIAVIGCGLLVALLAVPVGLVAGVLIALNILTSGGLLR